MNTKPLPPHRKVTAHGRVWTEEDMRTYAAQEAEPVRLALSRLLCYFPTDEDMNSLGWGADYIERACAAYDNARAALGA